ncbi:hypothetical protein [Ktedonobacter robiniae]|uniref:hypothetical protein n=1 Tax=Ktedonobacter robiniae TaxID=2778365 RepID=UPI001916B234|nr:hypothetical protein [Ktedonobacter robiniae]
MHSASRVQRALELLKQQLLACCHFELDHRRHIINYQSHCGCCPTTSCCAEPGTMHITVRQRK